LLAALHQTARHIHTRPQQQQQQVVLLVVRRQSRVGVSKLGVQQLVVVLVDGRAEAAAEARAAALGEVAG
jgi:hypothetical protein